MFLYTILVSTDSVTVIMCPCALLAARSVLYYWMNVYYGVVSNYCGSCRYGTYKDVFVLMFT